jgi:hypothetical protein
LEALREAESAKGAPAVVSKPRQESADKFLKEEARAAKKAAAEAAKRKKEQEEAARRVEKVQKEMNHPAPATASTLMPSPAPSSFAASKEQRLADLLRRYQADEISPLQYHTERAKIIAEP